VARKLIVEVFLDAAAYNRQIKQAQAQTAGLTKGIEKTGKATATASVAFKGLGKQIAGGVLGAASAGAAFGAVTKGLEAYVVFGQAAAGVKAWSQTTTAAFGVSQRQAVATASSFGALFKPIGLTGAEAAKQSEKLTQLGADLASFYNTDVQSALDAIRSGIVGESEPLRQYGVLLSETRVQQEALRDTGKTHVSQLTNQEKALARINIIFKDSKTAQGDFARTSEGLANQTRVLTANIDDLATKIGSKLIPVLTQAVSGFTDMADAIGNRPSSTKNKEFADGLVAIAHGFKEVNDNSGPKVHANLLKYLTTYGVVKRFVSDIGRAFPRPLPPPSEATKNAIAAMQPGAALNALLPPKPKPGDLTTAGGIVIGAGGPSFAQQNRMFDATIGRLQLRAGLKTNLDKQIADYRTIASKLRARIKVTGDITRQLHLEDQALQADAQVAAAVAEKRQKAMENLLGGADIPMLQAQLTKSLSDDVAALELQRQLILTAIRKYGQTKALQLQLIQNQIDTQGKNEERTQLAQQAAEQARQEKVGWMEFAFERAQATKTVADDLKTAKALLSYWQKQAATGKRTLEEAQQVWHWQQEITRVRKEMARDQGGGTLFRPVNANAFIASLGLGLTPDQVRRLRAGVVQFGPGGTLPGQHTGAFALAGGVQINGGVHLHGVQNIKQMEEELAKRAKARPHTRRGAR
jgi:hypothetical protein